MVVEAALVGSFPRPFSVGRLMSRYRDGKIDPEAYEEKLEEELVNVLRKIADSNVFLVPFNMFLWDDLFEPFASSFDGIERGGLYRFLDNNFYYRAPVVKGRIKHRDATLTMLKTVKSIIRRNRIRIGIKAVIPGPYTFLKMCENKYYSSEEELVADIAGALGEEAQILKDSGVSFIEIHEPLLVSENLDKGLLEKAYETIVSKISRGLWLQTYFGPISRVLQELSKWRIDVIGIDVVEAPEQLEKILSFEEKWGIGLGAVNSRSTRIEKVGQLRMLVEKTAEKFKDVYLTPNAMMDFIPVSIAYVKIRRMGLVIGGFKNE
jgi:5-methyltetrahydropteroyltriglutamate--homocysteine methyltransferase